MTQVLIVEDGQEYSALFQRYLTEGFSFTRAGDGPEALLLLQTRAFAVIFLDMRFDRAEPSRLLGDLAATTARLTGDEAQARRHLEDHQGVYILAALREAGVSVPVVMSYDFDGEPRRFKHLESRYAPLSYLTDDAGPAEIRAALGRAGGG